MRDVYTYTSMISGRDALPLFADVRLAGVTPNKVTILGELSGRSHAGFVEYGLQHYDAMAGVHALGVEHFACMPASSTCSAAMTPWPDNLCVYTACYQRVAPLCVGEFCINMASGRDEVAS
jgi:hypothetical protein